MIGWSAEFAVGEVRPLKYFGEDLVGLPRRVRRAALMEAHCKHLGAHIGHGGKVVGDCVECPFHGWRWGPDGTNRYIPYQPDKPNRGLRLRSYPVKEQYGCIFMWHQPERQGPAVGDARHLHEVPPVRNRPGCLLPALSGVLQPCRRHPGAPADRRRERARQCTFPLRARRHRDPGVPALGERRRGVALPHRLARRPQRRPGQDGAAHPQPLLRTRRRDQRLRGFVELPADLRLHARRRRGVGHVLFDLVAEGARRRPPTSHRRPSASGSRRSSS